jgi:2-hydroxychromene-2-carboxylate isomerase
MGKQMKYFFAFPSPFAALADARIDDLVAGAGGELEPIPVVPPPMPSPEGLAATIQEFKISYALEDSERCARKLGLKWTEPPRGVDATDASAGYYFAREQGCERAYRNAVFVAGWGAGGDISDRDVLKECARKAGLSAEDFMAALASGQYQERVMAALQLCVEERVFGVPTFVVKGKRFWGNDRLETAIEELKGA